MEYRVLGKTGLHVSRLCLGTMTFGAKVAEDDAVGIIHAALDAGVNFIDTANIYVRGRSEEIVGKALAGRRDKVVLATKCSGAMSDDPLDRGLSRSTVLRHVDDSLRRLGTDYVDLLYLHFPDLDVSTAELVQTMGMLVASGKVRHYGISNFAAWRCCEFVHTARALGLPEPVASQNVYNAITRGLDDELLPFLEKYRLGLVTYNPLAGGLLTGKHEHGKAAPGTRLADDKGYALRYMRPANIEAADELAAIARDVGISPAELAYRWLLGKGYLTSIICGVSKPMHLEENLRAFEGDGPFEEAVSRVDELWDGIKGDYFNYHYNGPLMPPPPPQGKL